MGVHVKVGATMQPGVESAELLLKLKLGNFMSTFLPKGAFEEALEVARFCRKNKIYFIFWEFFHRGEDIRRQKMIRLFNARELIRREDFYTREQVDQIFAAAGKYYMGRMTLGEVGGLLYWPREYTADRAAGNYVSFTRARNVQEARDMYVNLMRETIDAEREIGGGNLLDIDSSMTFKYHFQAGIDMLNIESQPGDYDLLYGALRGASRAYGQKEFGAHIAIGAYAGPRAADPLWLKRWQVSLYFSYISGSAFIYPESGHMGSTPDKLECRRILREFYQFANIHARPAVGPKVRIGFVYGHLDGFPGLWNKRVWGQAGKKWLHGPAEWGWDYIKNVHRKEEWFNPYVVGGQDFSGHLPGGLYDVVPIEAPSKLLNRYPCLIFLGWNTMTEEIYGKLKDYVAGGGHLLMSVPHLSTHLDRAADLKLFRGGDFSDLFGVKITGKGETIVTGVKSVNDCSIPSYTIRNWAHVGDPCFIGNMTPARVKLAGAQVLVGAQARHVLPKEEVAKRPLLVEHSLGKGKAFLITTWEYPGAKGMEEFVNAILMAVYAGEQTRSNRHLERHVRVAGSDRVRHAVYSEKGVTTVYLLNTDLDSPHPVNLHVGDTCLPAIEVPATDIRIVHIAHGLVLIPEQKFTDIKAWTCKGNGHRIDYTSLNRQKALIVNLEGRTQRVQIGGRTVSCPSGRSVTAALPRQVDEKRKEFFAKGFLDEPPVKM